MLELIGWDVGMSTFAAILLVAGALVIGGAAYLIGEVTVGYEWFTTGLGALVGGYLGSEALGSVSTWGPLYEGLYVLPAIIAGIIVAAVVDIAVRSVTRGTYRSEPRPI